MVDLSFYSMKLSSTLFQANKRHQFAEALIWAYLIADQIWKSHIENVAGGKLREHLVAYEVVCQQRLGKFNRRNTERHVEILLFRLGLGDIIIDCVSLKEVICDLFPRW